MTNPFDNSQRIVRRCDECGRAPRSLNWFHRTLLCDRCFDESMRVRASHASWVMGSRQSDIREARRSKNDRKWEKRVLRKISKTAKELGE